MAAVVKNLTELASIIRSKNAGPFEMTLDIVFRDKETYEQVKSTGVITQHLIAELYNIPEDQILYFVHFDAANAIKATLVRPRPQGSIGETDMHATQQHAPLLSIDIPWTT